MKNVTITPSEDLVQVLDSICKDCNLSGYAFAKEVLLEKIEKHTKKELKEGLSEANRENRVETIDQNIGEEVESSEPPFIFG